MWRRFTLALSFLTIFPFSVSGEVTTADFAGSYSFFPLIGFFVGLSTLLVVHLLEPVMPPLLLAVSACAFSTLITRGFHLDGLADWADGVGGGYTPQRRLEIMKDSSTGAFGALALIFAVLFKVGGMYSLVTAKSWVPFLLAPTLGRFAIVLTAYKSTYARPSGGLGKSGLDQINSGTVLLAAVFAFCLTFPLAPKSALVCLGAAAVVSRLIRLLAGRWLGGVTGDVFGTVNELTEVFLYVLLGCFAYSAAR